MSGLDHSTQTRDDGVHTIIAYAYANSTARLAATGFVSDDVGKVAVDLDTNALNWLVDDDPITWASFDAGAAAQLNKVAINCRKSTAGTLAVGTVVCAKDYDETNEYALVEAAKADSATTLPVVGVISVEATDSTTGKVLVVGVLGGLDTSSLTAQYPLYVSAATAGEYTVVPPSGPYVVQSIGVVLSSDASDGYIGVNIGGFRAIEYATAPLAAGSAAAGTSNEASASDHVHPTELVEQSAIYYVGKHGNDSNDGQTIEAAFLTFSAALAEALSQTPSAFNPFNIVCLDAGGYTEDFTIYSYCVVTAPAATIVGEITLQDYAGGEFLQILVGAGETAVSKTSGTETSSIKASGINATGSGNAIKNDGTDSVIIAELDYINVEDGDAVHDNSSGDGHIHARVNDIYISGDGRGLVTAGGAGKIYADIQEIEDKGAGTTTAIEVQTGKIRCNVQHIDCDTAWTVASGATLEAFIGSSSGTTTETGTVDVSIAGEATGETNTASNVGTAGVGVYKQKTGVNLEFKKVNAGSAKITITDDTGNDEVDVDVVTGTDANSVCVGNDSRLSDARTPTSHATSHEPGGGDAMAIDAVAGTGSLRTLGTASTAACAGNDSRLSDARTPTSHATSHQSGGSDSIKLDDFAATDDNTDLNATTSAHGLLPKLAGGIDYYLRGDGTWSVPAVGGGEANTASNVGTAGVGVFKQKTGADLEFKKINAGSSKITITDDTGNDEVDINVVTGTDANSVCIGNDSRLSDARTPTSHATSHQSGGGDAIKLDDLASPNDNTDLNATTSVHGLLPKLGGGTTNYLRADGTWAEPAGADADAIHDNVAGEINAITEKTTPVSADLILIEDSAATNAKKKIQIGNLPAGVFGSELFYDEDLTDYCTDSTTPITVYNENTPSLPNGDYFWLVSFRCGLTNSPNYTANFLVYLDDSLVTTYGLTDSESKFHTAISRQDTLSGVTNFKIKYYVSNDATTALLRYISTSLWRVS